MKRAKVIFCLLLFFIGFPGFGQHVNPDLVKAYNDILDLKLRNESPILFTETFTSDHDRAFQMYIKNLRHVLDLLIVKNKDKYNEYPREEKILLDQINELNQDDPFVAFFRIEFKVHRGLLKIRYGDRITGALNLIQAFRNLNDYEDKYAGHNYTLKTAGLLNVLLSVFPEQMSWILNFLQVYPDMTKGIHSLKELSESNSIFSREGFLMYALAESFFNEHFSEMNNNLNYTVDLFDNSLLYSYLYGIISIKNRRNGPAIHYLERCLKFERDYLQIPQINYYRAEAYLRELNYHKAAYLYQLYLQKPNGDEFIKDSYYKLYNLSVLFQIPDQNSAFYRDGVITKGALNTGSDTYAYQRIMHDYQPDETLFISRILFDGGYYGPSLEVLESRHSDTYKKIEELSEYYYRYGRNFQLLKDKTRALEYFNQVVSTEGAEAYYFWGNSLLNIGHIYAAADEMEKARKFYERALEYKGEEYRNSIKTEAKTALKKLDDQ